MFCEGEPAQACVALMELWGAFCFSSANMSEDTFARTMEQATAFQKMWMESVSKTMQAAFTLSPTAPAPEMLQHIRRGILDSMSQSWEQFMRSPQFLGGMQQWMENAIAFRKMTSDMVGKAQGEMQSPSREDMEAIVSSVRQLEKRMENRLDEFTKQVAELKTQFGESQSRTRSSRVAAARRVKKKRKEKARR